MIKIKIHSGNMNFSSWLANIQILWLAPIKFLFHVKEWNHVLTYVSRFEVKLKTKPKSALPYRYQV